jgi:hypothetical protein
VIEGSVRNGNWKETVVAIRSYEFRTCGDQSFEPAMARGATCDLIA